LEWVCINLDHFTCWSEKCYASRRSEGIEMRCDVATGSGSLATGAMTAVMGHAPAPAPARAPLGGAPQRARGWCVRACVNVLAPVRRGRMRCGAGVGDGEDEPLGEAEVEARLNSGGAGTSGQGPSESAKRAVDEEFRRRLDGESRGPSAELGEVALPLLPFPLDEVMLPGETKELHLYEARYLSLLESCLKGCEEAGGVLGAAYAGAGASVRGRLGLHADDESTTGTLQTNVGGAKGVCGYFTHLVVDFKSGRASQSCCLCRIEGYTRQDVGCTVTVRGVVRVALQRLTQREPFMIGVVQRFDDTEALRISEGGDPDDAQIVGAVDALLEAEERVWREYRAVTALRAKLGMEVASGRGEGTSTEVADWSKGVTPLEEDLARETGGTEYGDMGMRSGAAAVRYATPLDAAESTERLSFAVFRVSPECAAPLERQRALETKSTAERLGRAARLLEDSRRVLAAKAALLGALSDTSADS